ncbi:ATP-binding cassette domain-containing protein [Glutamicibacter sp. MNS18]|uniref:ABC transporter ATP-binding protein n=1 Tax=Glutamicibacter sp. MNS18 TaxID=2989817 RepID=UPI002235DFC4|nr:ATP-binding cassette domain-containing protein [Glutamicibacter sp. MNS18]MCW4465417.1 ATP-binding cassette domain-containing protein [Glutamicibacter sp. MNS18]
MTNEPIIDARSLSKRFSVNKQPVEAVTDLSFTVQPGELVAFLGPNGAGKSTSLRMLTTLIPPTSGSARVAGHDIRREPAAVRRNIGYVGQLNSGSFAQRVRDELISQGAFYGLGKSQARRRADELIESLDLAPFAKRSVQQLSGGQKLRLDVALGLMHAPPLLFLDEPSTGLDPQSRANLWQHIIDVRAQHGTTVFLTTHYLEEADRYAERVMVIDRGRMIADNTAERLKAELAGDALRLTFTSQGDAEAAASMVQRLAGRPVQTHQDHSLRLTAPDGARLLPTAVRELDAAGIRVDCATGVPPTLDDVFLSLTGRTLREADAPEESEAKIPMEGPVK